MSDLARALLARCTFPPPGTPVTCAVSGGADSTALLVLAVEAGCVVQAVHVDHGLRTGSDREADVVRRCAERVGASFRAVSVDLADGPDLEARARRARYAVLPDDVLTGHTADDLAETVVANLMRGSGLDGMSPLVRSHGPRRPLLDLRRAETRALCAAMGLTIIDDPMNDDPRFVRARVRHEIIPLLCDIAQRDVVPVLARQARLLADDAAALDAAASSLDPRDAPRLRDAPVALARRALRSWLRTEMDRAGELHPPSGAEIERVLQVVRGAFVATELEGGWRVARSSQRLRLTRLAAFADQRDDAELEAQGDEDSVGGESPDGFGDLGH